MAVEDVLNNYGQRFVSELSDAIKNKQLPRRGGKSYVANASGNLVKSLNYTVENGVLTVRADRYIGALVFGRQPNKNQTPESLKRWVGWAGSTFIKEWADVKGVKISPYAIAYSIARKGNSLFPQGSDLVSAIVTDDFINDLKSDIFSEITDSVFSGFKFLKKAA